MKFAYRIYTVNHEQYSTTVHVSSLLGCFAGSLEAYRAVTGVRLNPEQYRYDNRCTKLTNGDTIKW